MKLTIRNQKVGNNNFTENHMPTFISFGMVIKGDMFCNGDIKVDGIFEGNLIANGKIVLGTNGKIKGTIKAQDICIFGSFNGSLECSGLLSLKTQSKATGEFKYGLIEIDLGTSFTGAMKHLNVDEIALLSKENKEALKVVSEPSYNLKVIKNRESSKNMDFTFDDNMLLEGGNREGYAGFSGW